MLFCDLFQPKDFDLKPRVATAGLHLIGAGLLAWLALAPLAYAGSKPVARPKLGLALSGGGARGLSHIGVLKVMEEAGLRPDYIAGTSMGAVIGALYASGYTAAQIETIVLRQDWTVLLSDQVSRDKLSVQDKQDEGKTMVMIPIERGQITLPSGLVSGQNITLLLSRLLFPVRHVHDFHQLAIPFECMGTDIVTGEDVVLDHGDLVQAVRASMAIPSVFTPVEWGDHLLVDGGVTRNLPVSNLIAMGADLIIAVDVNDFLLPRDKINNLTAIFDQSQRINSRPASQAQARLSDLLIKPDVMGFSIASFDQARAIIAQGEAAARDKFTELQALAHRLGPPAYPDLSAGTVTPPEPGAACVWMEDIRVIGLQQVPLAFVRDQLRLKSKTRVTCTLIEAAVDRLFGSGYFLSVRYTLQPAAEGETLVLHVIENPHNYLGFGLHYDSEIKAMLVLNGSFQSVFLPGAKLDLDAFLSPYMILRGAYLYHPDWQADVNLGLHVEHQNGDLIAYNNAQLAAYGYQRSWQFDLITQSSLTNILVYGIGIQKEMIFLSGINAEEFLPQNQETTESLSALAYIRLDTRGDGYYPQYGSELEITGRWLTDYFSFYSTPSFKPFGQATFKAGQYFPLAKHFSLFLGTRGGVSFRPPDNPVEWFFVGGMTGLERHRFPFLGTRFIQRATPHVFLGQASLQWEVANSIFLLFRSNVGWTGQAFNTVFTRQSLMAGCGVTLGLETPVGPLEATLMTSNLDTSLSGFLSLGYSF